MKTIVRLPLAFVALGGSALAQPGGNLIVNGSDTLGVKLVPQLTEEFKADPGVGFEIAALIAGEAMAANVGLVRLGPAAPGN